MSITLQINILQTLSHNVNFEKFCILGHLEISLRLKGSFRDGFKILSSVNVVPIPIGWYVAEY